MKQSRMQRSAVWGVGFFMAGLLAAGSALATDYTWYADAAATGNNSGTNWANACTNIQGAIDAARTWLVNTYGDPTPGARRDNMNLNDAIYIVVRAGTYAETVCPAYNAFGGDARGLSGTANSAPLYIQSEYWNAGGKTNTIIVNPSSGGSAAYTLFIQANGHFANCTIRGFTIRSDASQSGQYAIWDFVNEGTNTIEYNTIEVVNLPQENVGPGYWCAISMATFAIIRHNVVRDSLAPGVTGAGSFPVLIAIRNDNQVYDNTVYACPGYGRLFDGSSGPWGAGEVSRNMVYSNLFVGDGGTLGLYLSSSYTNTTNVFFGNVFVNWNWGLQTGAEDVGNAFYNNTFYAGAQFLSRGSSDAVFNNLFINNWGSGNLIYEGVTNDAVNTVDAIGNYVRAPDSTVVSTTLPAGYTNMLPSEIFAANPNYLMPTQLISGAVASHGGYARLTTGINGREAATAQMGAVFWPKIPGAPKTNTWYVDAAATGDNSGTNWANACTTIQGAIDTATAWLTANYSGTRDNMNTNSAMYIIVRAGTYTETVYPGRKDSGGTGLCGTTNGAPLYIQSEYWDIGGKTNTIMVNTNGGSITCHPWSGGAGALDLRNYTIRGFTIRTDASHVPDAWSAALQFDSAGDQTFEYNIIEILNPDTQIRFALAGAGSITFRHNIFRTMGSAGSGAYILAPGSGNTFSDNTIYACPGYGVIWSSGWGESSRNTVSNNFFLGMDGGTLALYFQHGAQADTNNVFVGNVFVGWGWGSICGANDANVYYNNTIYNMAQFNCQSPGDTTFNNLFLGTCSPIIIEGVTNESVNAIDSIGNYVRAPVSVVASTTLPAGCKDMLPSEIMAANPNYLLPTRFIAGAVSSRGGHSSPLTGINGMKTRTAQIGAVFSPPPPGTILMFR